MNLKKMNYRPATKGHNRYCGPGALSILLQIDTAEAAARLRIWRKLAGQKSPSIRGTYDREMLDVIMDSGMSVYTQWGHTQNVGWMQQTGTLQAPTLNQWMANTTKDGTYLVAAGKHWFVIVIRGNRRYYQDNIVKEWVNARTDKRVSRRARMQAAYRIDGKPGRPTLYDTSWKPAPKPVDDAKRRERNAAARSRRAVQKMLAEGLPVTVDNDNLHSDRSFLRYVNPHAWLDDNRETEDPFYGDHYRYSWQEIADTVQVYYDLWVKEGRPQIFA